MNAVPQCRLAVVEDDENLRDSIVDFLLIKGYPAWGVGSAEAFYRRMAIQAIDLLIADIGLPGDDGFTLCRKVQSNGLPVIILSGRNAPADRIEGLECGANRYLVKPIDLNELVANIEAMRRAAPPPVSPAPAAVTAGWWLDATHWRLHAPNGRAMELTAKEYALLRCLIEAGDVPIGKHQIAETIWKGPSAPHRVDVLMSRLRAKCVQTLGEPIPVKTAPGSALVLTVPCLQNRRQLYTVTNSQSW